MFNYITQDPREALILSLKREVSVLLAENEHLRTALNVYSEAGQYNLTFLKFNSI